MISCNFPETLTRLPLSRLLVTLAKRFEDKKRRGIRKKKRGQIL